MNNLYFCTNYCFYMKNINLLSVIDAYHTLNIEMFHKLMNSYRISVDRKKEIKDYELDGIESLVNNMRTTKDDVSLLNNYLYFFE